MKKLIMLKRNLINSFVLAGLSNHSVLPGVQPSSRSEASTPSLEPSHLRMRSGRASGGPMRGWIQDLRGPRWPHTVRWCGNTNNHSHVRPRSDTTNRYFCSNEEGGRGQDGEGAIIVSDHHLR